jgi:excisionase family DNA binding protein
MGEKMLTPYQVACRLCVSLSLVYQLCKEQQLKHYRFGAEGKRGRIRIEESEVERYLSEQLQVTSSPAITTFRHLRLQ